MFNYIGSIFSSKKRAPSPADAVAEGEINHSPPSPSTPIMVGSAAENDDLRASVGRQRAFTVSFPLQSPEPVNSFKEALKS